MKKSILIMSLLSLLTCNAFAETDTPVTDCEVINTNTGKALDLKWRAHTLIGGHSIVRVATEIENISLSVPTALAYRFIADQERRFPIKLIIKTYNKDTAEYEHAGYPTLIFNVKDTQYAVSCPSN